MPRPSRHLNIGIIGLGLMGRELGSATLRFGHLLNLDFSPRITAICDTNSATFDWFESNFDTLRVKSTDYQDLLNSPEVEAIYCAVPHNLHASTYADIIRAGKHLLGEKPFGIDLEANQEIMRVIEGNPEVTVACSSEFPFFPAAQRILRYVREGRFGTIIEAGCGLLHSSDLDPNKKINWKRMIQLNGEYGCMGDLGMHALHIPLRLGWYPTNVRAMLSKVVKERPDANGNLVPCLTWDNATLSCEVETTDQHFPLTVQTYRIAPGESNTWYLRIIGTKFSVEYSTKYPKSLRMMDYSSGKEQVWQTLDLGYETAYPAITGGIFEFGFSDSLLQMWAAFIDEVLNGREGMRQSFYCATPQEAMQHHQVLTAAIESQKNSAVSWLPIERVNVPTTIFGS